tara:strand:- start:4233 stop:4571 length:339 start_codon:yes stop_codon:yes gene_type:complete
MNKIRMNELYNQGYKPLVYIKPNKKYDKMILKTILQKENENVVYPVYYNHVKNLLNEAQIEFIDYYNQAKLLRFNDLVELNIKSKQNTINKQEMAILIMYKSIKKLEYLEQK